MRKIFPSPSFFRKRTLLAVRRPAGHEDPGRPFDPTRFVRVHRSAIVNVARVRQIRPQLKGDAAIDLEDGTELRVSRGHRARLLAALARR